MWQDLAQREHRASKPRVAIVGGGPGGLFSALHLEAKTGDACEITIFEASERAGGKIETGQFPGIGPYEAGVAEIYDYSCLGPDPLKNLIVNDLGLEIKYIAGGPCVLDGKIILTADDLAQHFGERARDEAKAFRAKCAAMLSPEAYYLAIGEADNVHPWSKVSGEALLADTIKDEAARRYIRAMAHSDLSAAPHQTNGLTYCKNVLMDVDGYMDIYSVVGGNEKIVQGLLNEIDAEIRLNSHVRAIQPLPNGSYCLEVCVDGVCKTEVADYVILALPLTALSTIHWRSEALQETIHRHVGYFDRPGHYLRATLMFERPFWRNQIPTDWFMLDAFDGCCVYDESRRHDLGNWGVLAFLIAGNAALSLANISDERIEKMCLDALPPEFSEARDLVVDRRIHRWMASVNAIPGGLKTRHRMKNHRPAPALLPGVIMVGDYMFDATLNGVMDSADVGSDIILADLLQRRRSLQTNRTGEFNGERWSDAASTEEAMEHCFPADALADMVSIAWGLKQGARILHLGSASGRTVSALRALGFDAFGVEFIGAARAAVPSRLDQYNILGELTDLPFEDQSFDVVIETGLCRLPREKVTQAIEEIWRVSKRGMVLGSVTIDLPIDLIERDNLLQGVRVLGSRWDWSEKLYAAGFTHALMDERLGEVWKRAEAAGSGAGQWYDDAESVLYCFYQRNLAPVQWTQRGDEEPKEANDHFREPLVVAPGAE
jgi:monoamine oxidase/SAM-dependent methyltransferase